MRRILLLLTAFLLVLPTGVRAQTADDYNALQHKLDATRKLVDQAAQKERALKKDIASTSAKRSQVAQDFGDISTQAAAAQAHLDDAESSLGGIQQQLAGKEDSLQAAMAELDAANAALRGRAVQVYKTGPASLFEFILGSRNFSDFATRLQFAVHVFRADNSRIDTLQQTRDHVIAERDDVARLREAAAAQVGVVASQRDHVAALRNPVRNQLGTLNSQLKQQAASLEDVQQDKETYLRQERELEQESSRIAGFLKGHTGGKATVGPGGMIWPVQGPISSPFGMREHPIFHTKKMHTGIDIAAPAGTTIEAAAAGTVIFTGQKGGYGNVVIIDHGGGLATLYAHMSSIGASTGQKVGQGESIGRVGCTGYCTGPHLHFEVRVDGEPQNPTRWLP